MRTISRNAALLALPTLIHAVSLADLAPRAENLPSECQKIYTMPIPGCNANDFKTADCSQSCVSALEALVTPIKQACGNHGITGQNLIVAYLLNVGPAQICSNAPASYTGGPPTGSWTPYTSGSSPKTTKTEKSTVTSGVLTASSIKSHDSSTLLVDTSKTPTTGALQTSTSNALPSQLNTNDHSGGGSPFDTAGNMGGAASLSVSTAITFLSAAVALFANFR